MFTTKNLIRQAVVAAIYAVLTYSLAFMSFHEIQFRLAEVLNLLAFFNPSYILGVTVGCFIANLGSPFGIVDAFVGTLATFLATFFISKMKNIWVASIMPAIANLLIAVEIVVLTGTLANLPIVGLQIAAGEIAVVMVVGVPLFKYLKRQPWFNKIIC